MIRSLPDNYALVLLESFHVIVAAITDGKDVWREFADLLATVELDLLHRVDRQNLVGVHRHKDGASVGLQKHNNANNIL